MRSVQARLYHYLEHLVAVEMFLLMVTVAVDVLGRYLFNKPLPAGYELIQVQMGIVAFTALPLLSRQNDHIALGLLDHLFTGNAGRVRSVVVNLFSASAMAFLAWRIGVYASQLGAMDERTPVLGFPFAPLGHFMSAMAWIGAGLLVVLAFRVQRRS